MGVLDATTYEITHIKKGGSLNVRDVPFKDKSVVVDKIAFNVTNITVKECTELEDASEWCYINAPRGASHIEGWVSSYYLKEMSSILRSSKTYIKNFLENFYLAEEENYLDKLKVFYAFPMQKYLWNKNISLRELRSKKVNEYKLWPKRNLNLTYVKILKRKENYIDVQTTVRWSVKRSDDYERGKDIQKLRLVPAGNTYKVIALKNLKHTVFPKVLIEVDINESKELLVEKKVEVAVVRNHFYIKSGSFFSNISENYLSKITNTGLPYSIQKVQQGNKIVRRVYIGPFLSMIKAQESLAVVRAKINEFAYISKIR